MYETETTKAPGCTPTSCATGANANCAECCALFTDPRKREAFGYQAERAQCECHDICVEDVRDIGVKDRTILQVIPCNVDGTADCRGGFLPDGIPVVQNFRVSCADATLSPATGCDRINNQVEFEVVLRYGNTLVVVTPKDSFSIFWHDFARFPSGQFFPDNPDGKNQFRRELTLIDGFCKVISIKSVTVVREGNDCVLKIEYRVIDKLWKHENLLVSAILPYPGKEDQGTITVSREFDGSHFIGPCMGEARCSCDDD